MKPTIYWDNEQKSLLSNTGIEFEQRRRFHDDFMANYDEVTNILIRDLADALRDAQRTNSHEPREINFAVRRNIFKESPNALANELLESTEFSYDFFDLGTDGILRYGIECMHKRLDRIPNLEKLITPILNYHGIEVESFSFHEDDGSGTPYYSITMLPSSGSRLIDVIQVHSTLALLICYPRLAPTSMYGAYSLVRAGSPDALVGQLESSWLEVKQKGYGLQNPRQQYELALDMASFANSPEGGMVIIGASTSRDTAGRDVVSEIVGCKKGSLRTSQYLEVLNRLVFPKIQNLKLHLQPYANREVLMIHVPRQPSSNKPFLVRGFAIDDERVRGTAITIPIRVGDAKTEMTIEEAHRLIQRGMNYEKLSYRDPDYATSRKCLLLAVVG